MNRGKRIGRLGGLAAVAVAATPFACLWVSSRWPTLLTR
jgi:hypothetical protein